MPSLADSKRHGGSSTLTLAGVCASLQGEPVLKNVSLQVGRGSLHALVGPNGAGKSTLMRAVLGLTAFEGSIECRFERPGAIGYVPQNLPVDRYLPLTVGDFLRLAAGSKWQLFGRQRLSPEAQGLLDELAIAHTEKRRLGDLSGGERQRVLLVQALLGDPELLLLDEPASAVDQVAFELMETAVKRRCQGGTAVLWITHDLSWVRESADQVTCICQTVMFAGQPATMLTAERVLEVFRRIPRQHA